MYRSCVYGLATIALIAPLTVAATLAHAAECQDLAWSRDRLSKFDSSIASLEQDAVKRQGSAMQATVSLHQLSEFDAAIGSLEQDVAARKGDAAVKGKAILDELRASRDAYRAKFGQQTHIIRAAQAAESGQPSEEAANAFWGKVNTYLDAVDADVATRQAATQVLFVGN